MLCRRARDTHGESSARFARARGSKAIARKAQAPRSCSARFVCASPFRARLSAPQAGRPFAMATEEGDGAGWSGVLDDEEAGELDQGWGSLAFEDSRQVDSEELGWDGEAARLAEADEVHSEGWGALAEAASDDLCGHSSDKEEGNLEGAVVVQHNEVVAAEAQCAMVVEYKPADAQMMLEDVRRRASAL